MTFAVGHVHGGTGAGRKRALLPQNTIPWNCECGPVTTTLDFDGEKATFRHGKLNPGYLKRCIDCGATRDGGR